MNPLHPTLLAIVLLAIAQPSLAAPLTRPLPSVGEVSRNENRPTSPSPNQPNPPPPATPTSPPKPAIPYSLDPQPNDPLLPPIAQRRDLSPLEKSSLRQSLDRLDLEAQTKLNSDPDSAFRLWFRSLSLRRHLGPQEETIALGRIGGQAWSNSRAKDVQAITQRLKIIQTNHITPGKSSATDPQLLSNLGYAYAQVRAIAEGITIRELVLVQARQQRNRPREIALLRLLTQDYLNAFRYRQAALALTELIPLIPDQPAPIASKPLFPKPTGPKPTGPKPIGPKPTSPPADPNAPPLRERLILREQLVYSYAKQAQWSDAIEAQTDLIQAYINDPRESLRIAAAQFELGLYQENGKRWIDATQTYQTAYRSADASQQYAIAKTALQRLAQLYSQRNQPNDALTVYRILLDVEQRTYDTYGLIETHLTIGDLQAKTDKAQARRAYQTALSLAKQLNSRQAEIEAKLIQLDPPPSQDPSPLDPGEPSVPTPSP